MGDHGQELWEGIEGGEVLSHEVACQDDWKNAVQLV